MELGSNSFTSLVSPVFDGENYQAWAIRMQAYMEGCDYWKAIEQDYEVTPLSDNPTLNQINTHKEGKGKSLLICSHVSCYIQQTYGLRVSKGDLGVSQN